MFNSLIKQLITIQSQVHDLCQQSKNYYRIQYHPDLSPVGWHAGHCIYTENYWIREKLLQQESTDDEMNSLYIPEQSEKTNRGKQLPGHHDLCHWIKECQKKNISLLEKHHDNPDRLMQNNFLLHFLIQHYSQHYETLFMILCQAALAGDFAIQNSYILKSSPLNRSFNRLIHNEYMIGAEHKHMPYDNEHPRYQHEINSIKIAKYPVTNSEYLRFMEDGGYSEKRYWNDDSWHWCTTNKICAPEYWQLNKKGHWYVIGIDGASKLAERAPVFGVNHHEASAFATWAQARLPHECEWEAAKTRNLLQRSGQVWEWCINTFYPYEGFSSYPYEGYSTPYFDNQHFTLRGGSNITKPYIKRPSFRNYFQADKRFLFAGIRLVLE